VLRGPRLRGAIRVAFFCVLMFAAGVAMILRDYLPGLGWGLVLAGLSFASLTWSPARAAGDEDSPVRG
jgi:hypothetical protein